VTLVHQSTEEVPEEPDYYAQANQLGGGTTSEQVRATSPSPAPFPSPDAQLVAMPPPEAGGQERSGTAQFMTVEADDERQASDVSVAEPTETPGSDDSSSQASQKPELPVASELIEQTLAVAGLNAEYGRSFASTSRRKKHNYISANTKAYYAAAYMDAWRRKIERTGNLNYPHEARRNGVYGSLLLEVALLQDGTIDEVIVIRSSGHAVLDDAAVNIVRMSAPFAPFPKEISERTDVLHITRTWEFRRGDRLTSH
jgi:protein TonB